MDNLEEEIAELFADLTTIDLRDENGWVTRRKGWQPEPRDAAAAFLAASPEKQITMRKSAAMVRERARRRAVKAMPMLARQRRPGPRLQPKHRAMIAELHKQGLSQYEIARRLGTTRNTIYRILSGRIGGETMRKKLRRTSEAFVKQHLQTIKMICHGREVDEKQAVRIICRPCVVDDGREMECRVDFVHWLYVVKKMAVYDIAEMLQTTSITIESYLGTRKLK